MWSVFQLLISALIVPRQPQTIDVKKWVLLFSNVRLFTKAGAG